MINQSFWLSLPADTRNKLAVALQIPRTGGVEVVDNRVTCDGFTSENLMSVTPEVMQKFTGSESEDLIELFNLCVTIVTADLNAPMDINLVAKIPLSPEEQAPVVEDTPVETPVEEAPVESTPIEPAVEEAPVDTPVEAPIEPVVEEAPVKATPEPVVEEAPVEASPSLFATPEEPTATAEPVAETPAI